MQPVRPSTEQGCKAGVHVKPPWNRCFAPGHLTTLGLAAQPKTAERVRTLEKPPAKATAVRGAIHSQQQSEQPCQAMTEDSSINNTVLGAAVAGTHLQAEQPASALHVCSGSQASTIKLPAAAPSNSSMQPAAKFTSRASASVPEASGVCSADPEVQRVAELEQEVATLRLELEHERMQRLACEMRADGLSHQVHGESLPVELGRRPFFQKLRPSGHRCYCQADMHEATPSCVLQSHL